MKKTYPFELPELPYSYEALEPVISKTTLEFHHDKHFQTYLNNLNDAISKEPSLQDKPLKEILKNICKLESPVATAVRNNGGGVYNHNFYFEELTALDSSKMSEYLENILIKSFGTLDKFYDELKKAAVSQFGSGWAWLVADGFGNLKIVKTANQDTPLADNLTPLLNVDVWEHAYYLDYQNRRPDYVSEFMKIINWDIVEKRLKEAK